MNSFTAAGFASLSALLAAPAVAGDGARALVQKQSVIADYAACVFAQHPEKTRELLATEIDSKDEYRIAKGLLTNQSQCTDGRAFISMKTGEARGALAEAVLKNDTALAQRFQTLAAEAATRASETEGRRFVMAYSRCLVASSPDKARGLMATGYGAPEEQAAMMAFDSALKDCMPEGFAYRLNIRDVRNHVATALYDRAMASAGKGADRDG